MPMKDLLHRLQPVQLYIVLTLSICYFLAQLFLSHITHALTLLVDSYHMLCNIIALSGCILTIKHSNTPINQSQKPEQVPKEEARFVEVSLENQQQPAIPTHNHELKLKNTFGWTRIDVLTMLIVCVFLASLSFSLLVEALQTLIHIDHQDTMHHPIPVLILGGIGLIINGLCYLLIGGYTMHQGSFLHITSTGEVVLENVVSGESLKPKERRLSKTKRDKNQQAQIATLHNLNKRQGLVEMFRDVCSTLFVIVCAIIIYFADDESVTKFVDPSISIASCILLLILSYPYMKESCLILLQTIPGSIDIEMFKTTLLTKFDDIVNVHDLHIWQLTASKYVSTAHIIFQNPKVFTAIMDDVINFFHEQGITIVTIQPEFNNSRKVCLTKTCLFACQDPTCVDKHCCRVDHCENKKHHKIIPAIMITEEDQTVIKDGETVPTQETITTELCVPALSGKRSKSIEDIHLCSTYGILKRFSSEPKLSCDDLNGICMAVKSNELKKTETDVVST